MEGAGTGDVLGVNTVFVLDIISALEIKERESN